MTKEEKKEAFQDKEQALAFINAALEECLIDRDVGLFLVALKEIVIARGGITQIARKIGGIKIICIKCYRRKETRAFIMSLLL